ncbi:hypothetical protein ACQ86B_10505 [Mycolicibacterium aichiense]|uniref:hypothetical protein n=1 Tax=Mycolicibacterium aichiense TaxID=1799 RepID=UPI003D6659E4
MPPDAAAHVNAGAAANLLRYQLIQAAQQYPGARNLVFYLGEGAGGSTAPQSSFEGGDRVSGGAVFGYGTAAGGPIPGAYVDGAVTYLSDARSGGPVISTLDESRLRRVADELGVQYVQRDPARPVTRNLPALRPDGGAEAASLSSTPAPDRVELYWLFALLSAVLLLPEIYLAVREFWRNRTSRRGRGDGRPVAVAPAAAAVVRTGGAAGGGGGNQDDVGCPGGRLGGVAFSAW